jgi:hypothetical protein
VVRFQRQTVIPLDPPEAFDLALSIDAHRDSFAESGEQAIAGVTTGIIGHNEYVTWQARHFGVNWTMTSLITEWDRPRRFVDEQHKGPFKSFWHEHRFTPSDGGTRVDDDVRFEAPLGPLGRLAEWLVLRRYMPHLIDVRNEFLVTEARRR